MPDVAPLRVQLIGKTQFIQPQGVPWAPHDGDADGPALAEFAGRACYQSWARPNPATATNAGYIRHILDIGHLSVLEHGTATFYITGVSRSLTHELIRHRHFSPSQLSQRYVSEGDGSVIMPEVIAAFPAIEDRFHRATEAAFHEYREIADELTVALGHERSRPSTATRKQIRQAARALLPNATETRIVLTGNYRTWRHFIDLRATAEADVEIRALAVAVLRELRRPDVAEAVFRDYEIHDHRDVVDGPCTAVAWTEVGVTTDGS